jgi:hypothetical protein
MPRRFVDLSIYLENDVVSDPPAFAPKIEYFTHEDSFAQIEPFFPGLKKEDLPDGEGWAVEMVQLCTHNGTHLDAPYHFHSTMDKALGEKKPAIAIDDVPLEWCFQPGVKLDFCHLPDGHVVTAAEVEAELKRINHTYNLCPQMKGVFPSDGKPVYPRGWEDNAVKLAFIGGTFFTRVFLRGVGPGGSRVKPSKKKKRKQKANVPISRSVRGGP